MALRTITLASTVDQWKTNYNSLSTDVGDLSLLGTTHDSNLVLAINELIGEFDSATVQTLARKSVSAGTGIGYDSSTGIISLTTPSNTITNAMMADSAIGTAELRNDAVTTIKIADNAITFAKMADSSVGTSELRNNVVTTIKLASGAVGSTQLASGAVDSNALGALSISSAKIQANSIGFTQMADSAVGSNELRQSVELIIYNSVGSALKTLYGAGV